MYIGGVLLLTVPGTASTTLCIGPVGHSTRDGCSPSCMTNSFCFKIESRMKRMKKEKKEKEKMIQKLTRKTTWKASRTSNNRNQLPS